MAKLRAVVLAAGKGTRMRTDGSDIPKVMREALGRPLLSYVLSSLPVEKPKDAIVVVGYMKEEVMGAFPDYTFAVQEEQLGTGHAVMCAEGALDGFDGDVLICCGDTPLVKSGTYERLYEEHIARDNDCTLLSGTSETPLKGYGRVKHMEDGSFDCIVEEKDCTKEEYGIQEYNSGIYIFKVGRLFSALRELKADNSQGELYLTDAPRIMKERGERVGVCVQDMGDELIGVNTPEQLREVERILSGR